MPKLWRNPSGAGFSFKGVGPFLTNEEMVLEYMDLRLAEQAPRTTLSSLVSALTFLEEAGEVEESNRLSGNPSIQNTLKEGSLTSTSFGAGRSLKGGWAQSEFSRQVGEPLCSVGPLCRSLSLCGEACPAAEWSTVLPTSERDRYLSADRCWELASGVYRPRGQPRQLVRSQCAMGRGFDRP